MSLKYRVCSILLFCSGFCALIYQMSWIRQFRAIFGVSTQASAAVMAIFMGGLGLGALYLGKRVDRHGDPLRFYALLEAGISLFALISPLLMMGAGKVYINLGGVGTLGSLGATLVRLLLAILIIGVPTFLMGGTLPAMTRALVGREDQGRLRIGLLYGANTLGAFCGGLAAAFWLHEAWGVRLTLIIACSFNLVIATAAFQIARTGTYRGDPLIAETAEPGSAPKHFVFVAVSLTGLVFLLQEMVWYRTLSPLLGGSTYTISLILSGALLGIGVGGILYPIIWQRRLPTLWDVAITCALEAAFIGIPFAWGDGLAVWAASLGGPSFDMLVSGWMLVVFVVVVPASLVAGIQFPLLIALLGKGEARVGQEIGQATVLNSLGSILGSLAGGFGLMMLLGANGVWRLVIIILSGMALWAMILAKRQKIEMLFSLVLVLVALACVFTDGPGAPWKHAGIGVGRSGLAPNARANEVQDWKNANRRQIFWERDGIESTVGISDLDGYAFIVNGKTDGNALGDAPTQVMSGLIGAALHPEPKSALVVGLGTGSTAGWLGKVPTMERVDVVELEETVLHMAKLCKPVNEDALNNERVHTFVRDAREYLLTTEKQYDLIFSEPSNPYRAGISSMYTLEYYRDAAQRLNEGGLFLQWLQGYSVDRTTIERVYSTLSAEFPYVETWISGNRDLILVASKRALTHDAERLRAVLEQEPYARAMHGTWRAASIEGFLSRFYANISFSKQMTVFDRDECNRDDKPFIEFAMARSLAAGLFDPFQAWETMDAPWRRPKLVNDAEISWDLVDAYRINLLPNGLPIHRYWIDKDGPRSETYHRLEALMLYYNLDRSTVQYPQELMSIFRLWGGENSKPRMRDGWLLVAEWAGIQGDRALFEEAIGHIEPISKVEASALRAMYHAGQNPTEAASYLIEAFRGHQTDPWPSRSLVDAALSLTPWIAENDRAASFALFDVLSEPFVVESFKYKRLTVLSILAEIRGFDQKCVDAFLSSEPYIPWDGDYLLKRARCYESVGHALHPQAEKDLQLYRKQALRTR